MFESPSMPNMPMNLSSKLTGVRITKLIMRETGTYHPQFQRSYQAAMNTDTFKLLEQRVAQNRSAPIDGSTFSGVGLSFIKPQAAAGSMISIANGWGERRIRFMMEIEYERAGLQSKRYEVLTGYTDCVDQSLMGSINPDLVFNINSVMHVDKTVIRTAWGTEEHVNVRENSHVMGNPHYQGVAYQHEIRMRPQDVFASLELSGMAVPVGEVIYDTRSTDTEQATMSNRAHSNPNQYLGRLVGNYLNAASVTKREVPMSDQEGQMLDYYDQNNENARVYQKARHLVLDRPSITDPALRTLREVSGMGEVSPQFRYRDLLALDASIDMRKDYKLSAQMQQTTLHDPTMSDEFNRSDYETYAATVLSQVIPAIMTDLGLTRLNFVMHNHNPGGAVYFQPTLAYSFSEATRPDAAFAPFQARLISEAMQDLTHYNDTPFTLDVQADIMGELAIEIGFESRRVVQFVVPAFSDARMVPVLTTNQNDMSAMVNNVDSLMRVLGDMGAKPAAMSQNIIANPGGGFHGGF